ncbi:MAG: hypothetical protein K8U03_14640 [Planctomycetia bacterium]|nr:hypothetical protein [Planctomycetia bacterium]
MAPLNSYSNDVGREPPVRVVRRQLITSRGSQEMPTPRVVLHLPDLDALQTVALGPARPTSRRRIDAAHGVEPTSGRSGRSRDAKKSHDSEEAPAASPLLNLLRVPLNKWLPPLAAGKLNAGSVGQLVVLLQQPKVLLGAVVAVAMQLAAVLAMLGGGATTTDKSTPAPTPAPTGNMNIAQSQSVVPTTTPHEQHADHRHGPIRTPLNAQHSNGQPFIGPSLLPAPQSLAGADAKDVPPWQAPSAQLPPPSAAPVRNETVSTPTAAPIFRGPTNATSNATPNSTSANNTSSLGSEVNAVARPEVGNASTSGTTNVVQTSGGKAKLMGTIQRKPNGGAK